MRLLVTLFTLLLRLRLLHVGYVTYALLHVHFRSLRFALQLFALLRYAFSLPLLRTFTVATFGYTQLFVPVYGYVTVDLRLRSFALRYRSSWSLPLVPFCCVCY